MKNIENGKNGKSRMGQWVEVPATEPDSLSVLSGTEEQFLQVVL